VPVEPLGRGILRCCFWCLFWFECQLLRKCSVPSIPLETLWRSRIGWKILAGVAKVAKVALV